jgi:RNA-dependent RNA polymerase
MIGHRSLPIVILFELHTPPSFGVQCNGNRAPDGTEHQWAHKTYDRLSALDDAHARVAPFARHLRVLLANRDDLVKFERLCHISQNSFRPVRISRVGAVSKGFFSDRYVHDVYHWTETMDWKTAFQIEAYLRCGLLNTHDLLFPLQQPTENIVRDYGDDASELLRLFSVALRMRNVCATPGACLAFFRSKHPVQAIVRLKAPHGRFLLSLLPHTFFPRSHIPPNRTVSFDITRTMTPPWLGKTLDERRELTVWRGCKDEISWLEARCFTAARFPS